MPIDPNKPHYTFTDFELQQALDRIRSGRHRVPAGSDLEKFMAEHPSVAVHRSNGSGYVVRFYNHTIGMPVWVFFDSQGKMTAQSKSGPFKSAQKKLKPNPVPHPIKERD